MSGVKCFPCNETSIGRNGWYRNVLLTSYNSGEPVHQGFSVNQSTNNQIWLQHAKETANNSKKIVVFIFYDVCRVYFPKLLLFSVKIIQVFALETTVSRLKSRERVNETKFNG